MDYNPFNERQAGKLPVAISSRTDVSDAAKVVYAVLAKFAGKDGECFPGEEKIAGFSGKSIRRTRAALAELKGKKLITMEQVPGKKRRMIRFITPVTNILSTQDGNVRSKDISPDDSDQVTGRLRSISPDDNGHSYIKELKQSVKQSVKQRARERGEQQSTATFYNTDGSVQKEIGKGSE